MKLKIVNKGGVLTKVVNAETGEEIENVVRVEWKHDGADIVPRAVIEVMVPEVEVVGDGDVVEVTPVSSLNRVFRLVKKVGE